MGVKDPGKVRNQRVAKSQIVLIPILMNNVHRTLLLGLPRKQNGHLRWMYYASNAYISANRRLQHLWRLLYGLLVVAKLTGALMAVKDTSKVWNQKVAKFQIVLITGLAQQGWLGRPGPSQFLPKLNGGMLKPTYQHYSIYYICTSASPPGKMSQSVLCGGTIFDFAKRRRGVLDTSLNAKYTSEMNGNVSTIPRRSFGYYITWLFVKVIELVDVQWVWPSESIPATLAI